MTFDHVRVLIEQGQLCPKRIYWWYNGILRKLGVQFTPSDLWFDLWNWQLPAGWIVRSDPDDPNRWIVADERSRDRISIRREPTNLFSLSLFCRYRYTTERNDTTREWEDRVWDNEERRWIFSTKSEYGNHLSLGRKWLSEHFPNYNDPALYWS